LDIIVGVKSQLKAKRRAITERKLSTR